MSGGFAGTLTEQIVIERPSEERDSFGLQQPGWTPFARCRAGIIPEGFGSESEGQALSAMGRFRVMLRRRTDVRIDQRIRWAGRLLMVRQVIDDPRTRDRISLRCEEVRQ